MVVIKRIYAEKEAGDGFRVLVDRLWPRGVSKEKAQVDLWLKEIAPSNELRKWFGHDPKKWPEFQRKYKEELAEKKGLLAQLKELEKQHQQITLLYSAKDTEHNNAILLQSMI